MTGLPNWNYQPRPEARNVITENGKRYVFCYSSAKAGCAGQAYLQVAGNLSPKSVEPTDIALGFRYYFNRDLLLAQSSPIRAAAFSLWHIEKDFRDFAVFYPGTISLLPVYWA